MGTAASHLRLWLAPWRWWSAALGVLSRVPHGQKKHPFDRAHGVDTGGLIYAPGLVTGHEHDHDSAGYYATAPSLFRGAMELWLETLAGTGYALEDYALIDIGCGKGRVLMLATEYEFREIVGMELNPRLVRVASKNLRKWSRRVPQVRGPRERVFVRGVEVSIPGSPATGPRRWGGLRLGRPPHSPARVQIIEGDALTVPLPDGPLALFYFNSFEREMTEMWLARLAEVAAHRPWPIDLIYVHPEFDALVRRVPGIQALTGADIPFSDEDAAADAFGVGHDRCAIYGINAISSRLRGNDAHCHTGDVLE